MTLDPATAARLAALRADLVTPLADVHPAEPAWCVVCGLRIASPRLGQDVHAACDDTPAGADQAVRCGGCGHGRHEHGVAHGAGRCRTCPCPAFRSEDR